MSVSNCAVILAAGMGKRMKTDVPKVMCKVLGKPMLDYVLSAADESVDDICVVVGYRADIIKAHLDQSVRTVIQAEQLGTGHAVMQAADFIREHENGSVLVLCGDNPLMDAQTINGALKQHEAENNAITVITAKLSNPASYGRVVKKDGKITAIVEEKDADENIKAIDEINSGAYWFKAGCLLELLEKIDNKNKQHEYYLTDTVKIAIQSGLSVNSFVAASEDVVLGANDSGQLTMLNERATLYFG